MCNQLGPNNVKLIVEFYRLLWTGFHGLKGTQEHHWIFDPFPEGAPHGNEHHNIGMGLVRLAQEVVFSTSEPAYAVDHGGQIVAWNRAAAGAIGYSESEAVGSKCWKLLCGLDTFGNRYCCAGCPVRDTLFRQKTVNRFQISFKTASHEQKNFAVSALLLRSSIGKDFMIHLLNQNSVSGGKPVNGFDRKRTLPKNQRGNLTKREHEILTMLAGGKSTSQISSMLCVSIYTVRNHIQNILRKLQVSSRLQAITLGFNLGII